MVKTARLLIAAALNGPVEARSIDPSLLDVWWLTHALPATGARRLPVPPT